VIQLAQLLGYTPGQALAATGTVTFQTATTSGAVVVPLATQVTTNYISSINGPIVFETTQVATVPANGGTIVVPIVQGVTQGTAVFTIGNNTTAPFAITTELIGTSDGSDLQSFTLANNPVVSGSTTIYIQNPDFGVTSGQDPILPWNQVTSLQQSASSDQAWAETVDENGVVTIHFGDGLNGAVPSAGLNIYANYRVGGGIIGNLAANSIIDIASAINGVSISASSATSGGAAAETIDQIRANAPRAFTTQQRAVTLADYGNLAMSLPIVSQANAVANTYANITVYITGQGNTVPTQTTLDAVTAFLTASDLAGAVVTCTAATLVPINVGSSGSPVLIGCSSRYNPTSIQIQAVQAIQNLFAPSNVQLGGRVTLSSVYAALYSIPGVQFINIPLFVRSDATQSGAADILMRSFELATAGNIIITVTATT
jgi:predicted phage baseplate assembly protein